MSLQVINKKCTENQTRNIIRFAATSTDVRKQKILDLINQIKHNQSPTIKGFGLSLGTDFVKVSARLLDPPKIQYGKNISLQPKRGVWTGEGKEFLVPKYTPTKWGILNTNFRTQQNELNDLAGQVSTRYCLNNKFGTQNRFAYFLFVSL